MKTAILEMTDRTNVMWWMLAALMALTILPFLVPLKCNAADLPTALAKTISQIPDGGDTASMGNATTGLPSDYSTRNPGAVDALDAEPRNKYGVAAMYTNINFKKGPSVNLYTLSGAVRFPIGTLQVSYADGGSSNGTLDEITTMKFDSFPSVDAQYGLKLGSNLLLPNDELYFGVGYEFSKSKLTTSQVNMTSASPAMFSMLSESTSNTFETGALYRIAKRVNLGVMYLHSWDQAEDPMDGTVRSHTDQLRLGASVKLDPLKLMSIDLSTLVSVDYRHLNLPGGANDDQYFAGLEQYLIKDTLALYGGYANGGATTGLGIYLPFGGINFAYAYRPYRAIEEFFGKAQQLTVSVYGNW